MDSRGVVGGPILTPVKRQAYARDKYLIPGAFRLSEQVVAGLAGAIDEILADNPDIPPDRMINPHLDGGRPYGVKGPPIIDRIARDPQILQLVGSVLGPDVILWLTHLSCKLPKAAREVPWHQDAQYWPIRPWATCTVWIAIDKVDRENGAMRVIPGSQMRRDWRHHEDSSENLTLKKVISDDQLSEYNSRYIEL